MRRTIILAIVTLVISVMLLQNTQAQNPNVKVVTPMGHEMEYVRHIDEFLYVYRDTYTGTHYIVSLINGNYTVYRPLYLNGNMETVITN